MEKLKSKVAFLQGMAKGLDVNASSGEGKLLAGIIDVLDEFATELSDLAVAHTDLEDYVEAIDDDLALVEEGSDSEDESYTEIKCPSCGETLVVDDDDLEDDTVVALTCPHCGETIEDEEILFDLGDGEDGVEDSHHHTFTLDDAHPKE